jgi:hypothetical protein
VGDEGLGAELAGEDALAASEAGCVRKSFSAAQEKLFSVATVRKTRREWSSTLKSHNSC